MPKNLVGLVRETNPRPPASQKISCEKLTFSENKGTKDCKKVDHSEWDCQLKKKQLTVRVGLFSLREKAPTKNYSL